MVVDKMAGEKKTTGQNGLGKKAEEKMAEE